MLMSSFILNLLGWLYWNPPREAFTVPIIDRPIMWYGIFFVTGLIMGYYLVIPIIKQKLDQNHYPNTKENSVYIADRIIWYTIIGMLIGARLGEVFFYDWPYYRNHPMDIIKVWDGGLASHGGTLGVLIAFYFLHRMIRTKFPNISFISLIDMISIPTGLVCFFIRIGNFFNQEILGNETTVPWAIIFGHPIDGSIPAPRHPAQLYEGLTYLAIFIGLYTLWRLKGLNLKDGIYSGLLFIGIFGSRFIIEFWKTPLSNVIDESTLHMGQYLSIPFIILGFMLLFSPLKSIKNAKMFKRD